MTWSIVEVARMSGVTSRTLRHYDAIGLLPPAWVAGNGWRYYEQDQLLRLQRILLLRELGLGLGAIAEALDGEGDTVEALRRHHDALLEERDRLGRLVETVGRTIAVLERGGTMPADQMFAGFENNPYEAEARERYGDEVVDASHRRMQQWSPQDAERARTGFQRVHDGIRALRAEGVPVEDPRVQELVAEHYAVTSLFWTPTAAAYTALGRGYVDDERFRRNIGEGDDAMVEYLRDAMAVYAEACLD